MRLKIVPIVFLVLILLTACGGVNTADAGSRLRVLATTSIIGDVVMQVGGNYIALSVLMPVGADPHEYTVRPQDAAVLSDVAIIFANGAGLEGFLQPLLASAGVEDKLVEVSTGIELLSFANAEGQADGGNPGVGDPHTWMDPNNVIIWTENIARTLSAADPAHAAGYHANAVAYTASLNDLDAWICSAVAQVPVENRLLVSDHAVLGYFAVRYGFTQVGTITGSFSTEAAPSAQELAALEDEIRNRGVRAIFVTEPSMQALADQIAQDVGIRAIWIYHASLTTADGPAPNYLEFMRYNITAIVEALK